MYVLAIRSGTEEEVRRWRLAGDSYTLGRSRLCEIPISHQYLSRQHSRFERRDDDWWVVDLGSKNGTFVNEDRIDQPTRLSVGDRIRIADIEAVLEQDGDDVQPSSGSDLSSVGNSVILDARKFLDRLQSGSAESELSPGERRLQLLNEVHAAMLGTHDMHGLGRLMIDKLVELLDPDEAVVAEKIEDELVPLAAYPAAKSPLTISESLLRQVCGQRKAVLQQQILDGRDSQDSKTFEAGQSLILAGVWSLVATPILDGDRVLGMIALARSRKGFQAFAEQDLELLTALSSVAGLRMENLRFLAAAEEQRRLEQEIAIAREVQRSLLPDILPQIPGYDLVAQNLPSRGVSGDLYQVLLNGNHASLLLIDVSGKGVPAAILTATVEALVSGLVETGQSPIEIADGLGKQLFARTPPERYATGVLARLDPEPGTVELVSAGHTTSLVIRHTGEVERIRSTGPPWGLLQVSEYTSHRFSLAPQEMLLLYSDGITEAENPGGEEYGLDRLLEVCRRNSSSGLGELVAAVDRDLDEFVDGRPYHDDRTLLVIRRLAESP